MAEYTTHYNITKPTGSEAGDVSVVNANMDIIDGQMYQNAQDIQENAGAIQENAEAIQKVDDKFTGVESRTLLWTNASPTSTFEPQTISLDLSDYESVLVCLNGNGSQIEIPVGTVSGDYPCVYNGYIVVRSIAVSTSGVVFGRGGYYVNYVSGIVSEGNNYCKPSRIYGIKKVVA